MADPKNKKRGGEIVEGIDLESLPTRTVREKGLLYDQEVELYDYGLGDDAHGKPLKPSLLHPRAKSAKEIKRVPVDKFGNPLSQKRIERKKIASMAIAKSGRFTMLDVAYGFGLSFNKFEEEA